ncbi:MAG: hypothetical protein HY721_11385 [Planctomycetes bacterium]|nr:hypothetical protein [Planctomycetota bacterium]
MRLWILLSSIVVFAAGGAVGWLASRSVPPPWGGHGPGGPFRWFGPDPFERLVTSEGFCQDLGLDEQQKAVVTYLLERRKSRAKELEDSRRELARELREGIEAVLKPEQRRRLEDMQKERALSWVKLVVTQTVADLRRELELSPAEAEQVQAIFLDHEMAKIPLFQEGVGREDPRWDELRKVRDERMEKALPRDKYEKWLKLKEQRGRGRREGGFKRKADGKAGPPEPGPPPPGPPPGPPPEAPAPPTP